MSIKYTLVKRLTLFSIVLFAISTFILLTSTAQGSPRYNNELNSIARDNILTFSAYDAISKKSGEIMQISALYANNHPKQKQDVLNYFGDQKTATRKEIMAYVKQRFDIYAIETLSDNKLKKGATHQEIQTFISKHESVLNNVSKAMDGRYVRNGKVIRFNPYRKDIELTFRSFDRPNLPGTESWKYYVILRAGTAQRDEYGLLLLDKEGNTMWEGGWNGHYGGMDKDMLTRYYLRFHGFDVGEVFGAEASSIFFKQSTNRTVRNYDIDYDTVIAHFKKVAPERSAELEQKLYDGIRNFQKPTSYMYFTRWRSDYYAENRKKFIANLKEDILKNQAEQEKLKTALNKKNINPEIKNKLTNYESDRLFEALIIPFANGIFLEWGDDLFCKIVSQSKTDEKHCNKLAATAIEQAFGQYPKVATASLIVGILFSPFGLFAVFVSRSKAPIEAFKLGAGAELFEGIISATGEYSTFGTIDSPETFIAYTLAAMFFVGIVAATTRTWKST